VFRDRGAGWFTREGRSEIFDSMENVTESEAAMPKGVVGYMPGFYSGNAVLGS
jgi:hypothetical protein